MKYVREDSPIYILFSALPSCFGNIFDETSQISIHKERERVVGLSRVPANCSAVCGQIC